MNLRFTVFGAVLAGMLGRIRTQLVDMIADLTASTPLAELPGKDAVDAAVSTHIGVQYNTTIQSAIGPTAIGSNTVAITEGISIDDAIKLLDAVKDASGDVEDESTVSELLACVQELRDELRSTQPSTTEVVRKVDKLKAIAANVGGASLSAAVSRVVEGPTTMVMSGAFG